MNPYRFPAKGRRRLTDEHRRQVQPAREIIDRMSPRTNERCIDLGSGPGYITIPLSATVRCVLALDVQKEMLEALMSRAGKERKKIFPLIGEVPEIPLRPSSVDRVILINVAHEVDDKPKMAGEVGRILRDGGRLSIVDFPKKVTSFGPPVEERLSAEEMIATFSNMRLVKRWDFPEFYQLEFEREARPSTTT